MMNKKFIIYLKLTESDDFDWYDKIFGDSYDDDEYKSYIQLERMTLGLYAITDNKKYVNDFLNTRDADKFFIKNVIMSDDEYEDLISIYPNFELGLHALKTLKNCNNVIIEDLAFLTMTGTELNSVRLHASDYFNNCIYESVVTDFPISSSLFIKPYRNILDKVFNLDELVSRVLYPIEELPFETVKYNEVEIFISKYAKTINIEGMMKCVYTDITERMLLRKKKH